MPDENKPSSIHSKKVGRFTRRRLLKTLSAAGFTSATIGALSVEDVKAAASDQVPIALDVDGESIEYVDADWYDRVVRARKVQDALEKEWLPEEPTSTRDLVRDAVFGVWLNAGSGNSDPHIVLSLDKNAKALGEARGAVPERKQGIPVRIEETERDMELTACDPNSKSDTSSMPGGLAVNFSGDAGNTTGTLTPRVWDEEYTYDYSWITAAHVPENAVSEGCGSDLEGMTARHNGNKIGEVAEVNHRHDIAVIEQDGSGPLNEVWNPEDFSETYTIKSTMTEDAVDTWMGNDRAVQKYGVGRCYGQGPIDAHGKRENPIVNERCVGYWYDCVRWGTFDSIGPGDSGSIAFGADPNGGGYLASNINSWRWWDYSGGPAGYAIRADQGFWWG